MLLDTVHIGNPKDTAMDIMLPIWKRNVGKRVTNVCNIPNTKFFLYLFSIDKIHIFICLLNYAQNCLFYSTLGNCIDLLPGTCIHMKNVLTCKNRCVAELCKETCNNCKKGTYLLIQTWKVLNSYIIDFQKNSI